MLANLPKRAIFAHRGASAYAPENTLAAFELAIRQGADAIELDAKLSADGHVVIIHDATVDRTTDGFGRVADLKLSTLRELDAGSFFDASFQGERIPTLDEVFQTLGSQTLFNVELTNYTSPRDSLGERAVALVKKHKLTDRVLFSSFNPLVLRKVRRLLPEVAIGWLLPPGWISRWRWRFIACFVPFEALHPPALEISPELITKMHRRGIRVHVYTVNQPSEMEKLFGWGVDGIFTDDPLAARAVVDISHLGWAE